MARQSVSMKEYAAPSLFQPHRARDALRDAHDGKIAPLVGLYLALSTVPTSLFVAPMGFDMVWLDWEHSACNVETLTTMIHVIMFASGGATIPFVRVPGHDHAAIGYALDAGASIVVPQVETVQEAQHVVSSAKFGLSARGTRSAPPFRLIPGLTDTPLDSSRTLHQNLNAQAAVVLQIETLAGIRNLDAILTEVPGIDAVWLGTLDARVSMDLPGNGGMGGPEEEWVEASRLYAETVRKHAHVAFSGFALGDDEQLARMAEGKALVVTAADVVALMGLMGDLHRSRKVIAEAFDKKLVAEESKEKESKKSEVVEDVGKESVAVASHRRTTSVTTKEVHEEA